MLESTVQFCISEVQLDAEAVSGRQESLKKALAARSAKPGIFLNLSFLCALTFRKYFDSSHPQFPDLCTGERNVLIAVIRIKWNNVCHVSSTALPSGIIIRAMCHFKLFSSHAKMIRRNKCHFNIKFYLIQYISNIIIATCNHKKF